MIFVTTGSQKFQFNRLLQAVDELAAAGSITEEIFAQTGCSDYQPVYYSCQAFLDRETFAAVMARADIVITHGGTGTIIGALRQGKKVIAVPRLARYGEHVDDHQVQLIAEFREQNLLCGLDSCDELGAALKDIRTRKFLQYQSGTGRILEDIAAFIDAGQTGGRHR